MNRRNIDYDEIIELGLSLLKDETEVLYGTSDKDKAESVMRMCGIIDFLSMLDDATAITEEKVVEEIKKGMKHCLFSEE